MPFPLPGFFFFLFVINSFAIVFVAYWEQTKTNAYVQLDTIGQKYYLFFFQQNHKGISAEECAVKKESNFQLLGLPRERH